MSNSYLMPIAELADYLKGLYAMTEISDTMRDVRASMARAYHDRTGEYFAARFVY